MNFSNHKKKTTLVLGGGCIKASAFHIGVCSALQEKGFRFAGGSKEFVKNHFPDESQTIKTYIGSSAGAIIATFLASGFDVQTIIEAFIQGKRKKFFRFFKKKEPENSSWIKKNPFPLPEKKLKALTYRDLFSVNFKGVGFSKIFSGIFKKETWFDGGGIEFFLKKSFKVNGLFTTKNLETYLREHVCKKNSFDALGVHLYILATQLNYPKKAIFGPTPLNDTKSYSNLFFHSSISEAAAASASLPPFFAPFEIKNKKGEPTYFFDGDIRNPLATPLAEALESDLIIASYLVQPYRYTKTLGSLHEQGMPIILNQALYQIFEQKILQQKKEKETLKILYQSILNYMKEQNIDALHKEKILNLFESKAHYKKDVKTLYIHPDGKDADMFFIDHFSLNEKILTKIVKKGYKAALLALSQSNFQV